MALVKKNNHSSSKQSSTPKKQVIKVNPYENPENVLELMSQICSAKSSVNTDAFWNVVNDAFNKPIRGQSLSEYLQENRKSCINMDFEYDLRSYCQQLSLSLSARENTEHTQIVVAGGFSSGKSSFLNRLTNCTNLLPTGVEPVSVVKTYLYCSRNTRSVSVKGVNQKNVLVNLDSGVLQAIQHASKTNIFLASVLDKLFVEIPSNDLDGLVFIDTPGYNNTDKANESNGKTDRETALEAMKEGNVLFWLIDCERGTTVSEDITIIKQFDGKKVFIYNKADKKGYQECVKIVENAAHQLYQEFPREDIIDIIAYSTLDNKIYYSKNKKNLGTIVNEVKRSGNGTKETTYWKSRIEILFDDEIEVSRELVDLSKEEYKELVDLKSKRQKEYHDFKCNDDNYYSSELRTVLVNSYNNVMNAADTSLSGYLDTLNEFCAFLNTMYNWDTNDHECWNNTLRPKIDAANRLYDQCRYRYGAIHYKYYSEDYRTELVNRIQNVIDDQLKDLYDSACQDCNKLLEEQRSEEKRIKDFSDYKQLFMPAVEMGIKLYQKQNRATDVQNNEHKVPNVFDCIQKGDYKRFLRSFEGGVDLSVCNSDGYNPLTLAVQTGNNMMVQFMLDHLADPAIKDRRGYNAFHTAVENQYRDICKMLLDVDPDLISTKTSAGISVEALAKKQTFTKWIEQEIDNAL